MDVDLMSELTLIRTKVLVITNIVTKCIDMSSLILLATVVCACIIWIIYIRKKQTIERFNVLGGSMDIRYGTIGSTTLNAATLNAWIPVASWTNKAAFQNHAMTVEIYPHNRSVGATRQTFSVLVRNNDKAQESDPMFVQQNIFDSLADGTNTGPTFKTAALRYTTDPKNSLNNKYELFFQMGTGFCNNVSCAWILSDFTDTDMVAVNNTDQVATVTGGTKIYAPRLIGGDVKISTIFPTLQVGDSDKENLIRFKGVTGDGGSDSGNTYNMSVIAERLWGGPDQSELLLFKGNDNEACGNGSCGPDRIRLDSTGDVQIQTGNTGRGYDPTNNAGNTVFHARDDGRVSIGMQGQGKAGSKDRPTNMANPYKDRIGAPTTFIDRLEIGADPQDGKTAAVLRFNQSGSGMGEFYKPPGNVMYLRETPGQNGAAGSNFGNFNVQVPMTTRQVDATGNVIARDASTGQFLQLWPSDGAVMAKTGSNIRYGHADDTAAKNWNEKARITPDGKLGVGTSTPVSKMHVAGDSYFDGQMNVTAGNVMEFGKNVAGKEQNAGKIGYGTFDGGASLNVIGAGKPGQSRVVRAWDQVQSDKFQLGGKWLLSGVGDAEANDDWLRLKGLDGRTYYGGFAAGKGWFGGDLTAGNVWAPNTNDAINRVNAGASRCATRFTNWADRGGGNSIFLDRQPVFCGGGETLNGFQMENSGNNTRYRMNCCRP